MHCWITTEPSPTADATRFTDPENVPDGKHTQNVRRVVRGRAHEAALVALIASGSHSVRGSAPMRMKRASAGTSLVPSGYLRVSVSSRPSPPASTTSVALRTWMFDFASISSMRYATCSSRWHSGTRA